MTLNSHRLRFIIGFVLVLLVREIPLIHYPLDWIQTLFHELSHGLASVITGGSISRISIDFNGAGYCKTEGGNPPFVLFMGYIGSSIWGMLLYLSSTSQHSKHISFVVMVSITLIITLYARDWTSLIVLSSLVMLLFLMYRNFDRYFSRYIVAFMGLYIVTESMFAPTYLIDGNNIGDGSDIASLTFIPELIWIAIWTLFSSSILILLFIKSSSWYPSSNQYSKKMTLRFFNN